MYNKITKALEIMLDEREDANLIFCWLRGMVKEAQITRQITHAEYESLCEVLRALDEVR